MPTDLYVALVSETTMNTYTFPYPSTLGTNVYYCVDDTGVNPPFYTGSSEDGGTITSFDPASFTYDSSVSMIHNV